MPIHNTQTPFSSKLSGLLAIDDTRRKRIEADPSSKDSHDTIDTISCSEGSFSSLEAENAMVLKSIMKKTENKERVIECNDKNCLRTWIEQPIPSTTSLRRRRRKSTASESSSPNKYECVKTRFPGREGRRSRQERRAREARTEKTVEEQWVRTCRFLW